MSPSDTLRAVQAAIDRGAIPTGGPSEIAAYNLLDDAPAGYWPRWSDGVAERIRHGEVIRRCACHADPDVTDGRCQTCHGHAGTAS